MASKYDYDENGYFFNYLLLVILLIAILIQSYQLKNLPKKSYDMTVQCRCDQCAAKRKQLKTAEHSKSTKTYPYRKIFFGLSLVALGVVVYSIISVQVSDQLDGSQSKGVFDPYEILDIPIGTPADAIRKQFKKLSLQFHPDKVAPEDQEVSQEKFIRISKAYKTLTDEETRKNWEEWGDPDGRQSIAFSYGIALPAWMVSSGGEAYVLLAYSLLFGLGLPYLVSKWWSHSKSYTRDGILNLSMSILFQELKEEDVAFKRLIEILSCAVEFKDNVPWRGEKDMEAVMRVLNLVRDKIVEKTGEKFELPKKYNAPYVYKAYVLCYAHLFRILPQLESTEPDLFKDASYIIPKMRHLSLKGVFQIASSAFWLWQVVLSIRFSRMLLQATTGGGSPITGLPVPQINGKQSGGWIHMEANEFHQLPHFNAEQIKVLKSNKKTKNIKTINEFFRLPLSQRVEIFKELLSFSDEQIKDVLSVGRQIVHLDLESTLFECTGEDAITPGCLITFIATVKATNFVGEARNEEYGDKDFVAPEVIAEEIEKKPEAQPSDEPIVKRNKNLTKLLSGNLLKNSNDPVHSPYYPYSVVEDDNVQDPEVRPTYWLWLCNARNNRNVGAPIPVMQCSPVSFDVPGTQEVKFRFYAPQQPGSYTFQVILEGDGYTGQSLMKEVHLKIVPVSTEEQNRRKKQDQLLWDEFEKDEEEHRQLLQGGQMSLLGQGSVSKQDDSDSDDSSDSDSDSD